MRAALLSLLIPAALGGGLALAMAGGQKDLAPKPAAPAPAHRLTLQAYDAEIPKAPLTGDKLDTGARAEEPPPTPPPPPIVRAPAQVFRVAEADPPQRPRPAPIAPADPAFRRYVPSQQAGALAPDDPRNDAGPAPMGFHLTVPICRRAERQGDPLADTGECLGMLQQARAIGRMCAQAYEDGDDQVAMSPACRQAAMTR